MIALTTTSIAWLLFAVILVGWIVYAFFNIRQSRDELGSEIELAANRKPYYDDDVLEGPRLDRHLMFEDVYKELPINLQRQSEQLAEEIKLNKELGLKGAE